jgi:hypothetical protein
MKESSLKGSYLAENKPDKTVYDGKSGAVAMHA